MIRAMEETKGENELYDKAKSLYKKCHKLDKKPGKGVLQFVEGKILMDAYQQYIVEHPTLNVNEFMLTDQVYRYFPPDRLSKRQYAQKKGYDMEKDRKKLNSRYRAYLDGLVMDDYYGIDDVNCFHLLGGKLYLNLKGAYWIFLDFMRHLSKIYYAIARFLNVDEDLLCYAFDTTKYELLDPEFYRKQYVIDVIAHSLGETGESALSLSKKLDIGHSTLSKLFNGTENFTLKQFRAILPYLNISEDISERCLSYIAYLENSEIFWRGFEHRRQQATARKKLKLTDEKPK